MNGQHSRRDFLKTALAATGALAALPAVFGAPEKNTAVKPLRLAVIGCGKQGVFSLLPTASRERLVALVDADARRFPVASKRLREVSPNVDTGRIQMFTDYRKFFDVMHREVDAVFIATPNHQHALPALMAMRLGKGVYLEKPMAHDMDEVRRLVEWSRRYKVATQLGNQGHSGEGYRRLCEYINAGAIGKVKEVHAWCDRRNGGNSPVPLSLPVPKGLNWPSWIGPAPFREYHDGLHPHAWHGWYDFGNGSLGNMGPHLLDGAVWALQPDYPASVEVETMEGGTKERYPLATRIRWDFPDWKMYWYDGGNKPPLALELEKKYDRNFGDNATLYVGDNGVMYSSCYGQSVRLVPEEKQHEFPAPPKTLPRVKGSHHADFLRACREGTPANANFAEMAFLSNLILLGNLAERAGVGRKLEWDGAAMKCSNFPELNQHLRRSYRRGWGV